MKESDEGIFYLSNGIGINKDIDNERKLDVATHEFAHSMLYSRTTFGQVVMMLEKNLLMDDQSGIISSGLLPYLHRMQEQCAVNIEILSRLVNSGIDEYNAAIESLRLRNNTYFNYFRKLCCINGKVASEDDAEIAIRVIDTLARYALNVDLSAIPFKTFKNEKQIKRFFENEKNVAKYSPNKRFDILVNIMFRNNNANNDLESVVEGSARIGNFDDMEKIHELSMMCLENLYSDHPLKSRLLRRAESVGGMKLDWYEGIELLSSRPMHNNECKNIKYRDIDDKDEFIELYNKSQMGYYCVFKSVRGLEDFRIFAFFTKEGINKIINSYFFVDESHDEMFKLLGQLEGNVVFYNVNFMMEVGKYIRKMVTRLPIYVYIDNPVGGMLDRITQIARVGKFTFIPVHNKTILAIDNNRSVVVFSDILNEAVPVARRELSKRNLLECSTEEFKYTDSVIKYDTACNDYEDDTPLTEENLKGKNES